MSGFGAPASSVSQTDALARSRQRAALLPDLLVEARKIAHTSQTGWHGRKRRGIGEEFWQFRPFVEGEVASRIDWRRSARDDHVYVRDLEWQAAHTVWLWADASPSMLFQSTLATVSKESRALVLVLALAEILSRAGEKIGIPGLVRPVAARNAAERLATALSSQTDIPSEPPLDDIKRHNDVVIASDFLDDPDVLIARLTPLASRGVRGHLIEIADPVEETFPYAGRTEFRDPETGARLTAGRAEMFSQDYRTLYLARRETLRHWASRNGWSFITNHTDQLASKALVRIHMAMSESAVSGGAR